jgi:hypothetical protein
MGRGLLSLWSDVNAACSSGTLIERKREMEHPTMTDQQKFTEGTGAPCLESRARFITRQAAIRRIEQQILSGRFTEKDQKRLCELKRVDCDKS